ncbi:hypothetical protein MMC11_003195 [Xylographa trunciseda]|nr:hypothetical protein [Xylographa trunciseda]
MDPLSATVSIIALIGAGGSVAKGLRKIVSLKDAPDELQQLNHEVSAVCMIVSTIKECCTYRQDHSPVVNAESNYVATTLQRAKDFVLELEVFVAHDLTKVVANGDRVDRFAWLRAGGKVGKLKDRLRDIKADLGVAVNILNLTHMQQLEYYPVHVRVAVEQTLQQPQPPSHFMQATPYMSESTASGRQLEAASDPLRGREPSDSDLPVSEALITQTPSKDVLTTYTSLDRRLIVDFAKPKSCSSSCLCHGTSKQVQAFLERDEASVLDVDDEGESLLQKAVWLARQDCIEMFLAAGADSMQEDDRGVTPYMEAWSEVVNIHEGRPDFTSPFHGLFGSRPDFEKFGMSKLHVALRGWDSTSFDAALASTPRSSINEKDQQGRTALSIAAQSGSVHRVRELLLKGADPEMEDWLGRRPLNHLLLSLEGDNVCDEILYLLYCKDSVNHKDVFGKTIFHHVCRVDRDSSVAVLARLLALGADINAQDADCYTPLHVAIENTTRSNAKMINWLIDKGADLDVRDIHGRTPMMLALVHHENNIVELLLARGADYTIADLSNRSVLHFAAIHGDLESLRVLQEAGIVLQDPDTEGTDGWTPMDDARLRRDYNTKWADWAFEVPDKDPQEFYEAFEALYDSVEQRSMSIDWTTSSDSVSVADVEDEAYKQLPGSFPDD